MTPCADDYLALAGSADGLAWSSEQIAALPTLNSEIAATLATESDRLALDSPRRAWCLLVAAQRTGRAQNAAPTILARLEIQLSWLAGHWGYPRRTAFHAARARAFYSEDHDPVWEAVTAVALNVAVWSRPDYVAGRTELEHALQILRPAGLADWTAHGLHALAFAEMLTGRLEAAWEHLAQAKSAYQALGDDIGAMRVVYTEGGWYRRSGRADRSLEVLHDLKEQLAQRGNRLDGAKTSYQIGLNVLVRGDDTPLVESMLLAAEREFEALDMDLWAGQARNALAQLASNIGQLGRARQLRDQAIRSFARHGTLGLQADSLTDLSLLQYLHGELTAALRSIESAIHLYDRVGAVLSSLNAQISRGRILAGQARFQLALTVLEQANRQLATMDNPSLLAFCTSQLADVWLGLGSPDRALDELQTATAAYQRAERLTLQAEALLSMAAVFQQIGNHDRVRDSLLAALALPGTDQHPQTRIALLRMLGELGYGVESRQALLESVALCRTTGLDLELAPSLMGLADAEAASGNPPAARAAWQEALEINGGFRPEIEARARFGLARLAEASGDNTLALAQMQCGIRALKQVRRDFLQPHLAGGFAARWATDIADGVALAVRSNQLPAALAAIEAGKAQVFISQELDRRATQIEARPDLQSARARVFWLLDEIRSESALPGQANPRRQALSTELAGARRQYNELADHAERQHLQDFRPISAPDDFNLEAFRTNALQHYGAHWLAVNYFLEAGRLVGAWVAPDQAGLFHVDVQGMDDHALETCGRMLAAEHGDLADRDLERLARLLLPADLAKRLEPDSTLLIAPHGRLHDVPWAALLLADGMRLAQSCRPVVVPSFEAWQLLARRPERGNSELLRGLVLAVSQFSGNLPDLPGVAREAAVIGNQPGLQVETLADGAATPDVLLSRLAAPEGRFDFLHLATHLLADRTRGRLSGIAFSDATLLLDELKYAGDFPGLTVLSGCNGTRALTFAGDERHDFISALLLAGARTLVGSVWKVADEHALPLVADFYRRLADGDRPAAALAEAQRARLASGAPWAYWGGFQAVGI